MSRTKMRAPGNSEKKDKYRAKKLAEKLDAGEEEPAAGGEDEKPKKEKKGKKDRKEKKDKAPIPEPDAEPTPETPAAAKEAAPAAESTAPETSAAIKDAASVTKKRKRDTATSEIEIDVTLPEPPSKKALRKLKKHPDLADKLIKPSPVASASAAPKAAAAAAAAETFPEHSSQARSKWGIWIGNLGFSTTRPQLEEFLTRAPSPIQRTDITRINLPSDPRTQRNKGFAYIDFSGEAALTHALTLTEALLLGRKVLIKDAKDFSHRGGGGGAAPKLGPDLSSKPPSRILFVGNLDFATTDADLRAHFAFAGPVRGVRLATFEDSGKCKGFGFVDFEDVGSVKRAMLGVSVEEEGEAARGTLEGKEEEEAARRQRKRRFLGARQIKMEYGEDGGVRYKKRFGKDRPEAERADVAEAAPRRKRAPRAEDDWAERKWEERRQRQDKRDADPGAVYSNDVRRTGAITESKGTKMKFD